VLPALTDVAGEPLIVGARLLEPLEPLDVTVMENVGSSALSRPSHAEILMFDQVPVLLGVPFSTPLLESKVAHEGRFWIP
jgi:hypothetical protein